VSAVIYLVRHGETEWNLVRRYQGWGDSPLTERGLAQAEAIGRLLSGLPEARSAELVSSPIGRARRTAEIIRESLGRGEPLRFDDRLPECAANAPQRGPRETVREPYTEPGQEEEREWDAQPPVAHHPGHDVLAGPAIGCFAPELNPGAEKYGELDTAKIAQLAAVTSWPKRMWASTSCSLAQSRM